MLASMYASAFFACQRASPPGRNAFCGRGNPLTGSCVSDPRSAEASLRQRQAAARSCSRADIARLSSCITGSKEKTVGCTSTVASHMVFRIAAVSPHTPIAVDVVCNALSTLASSWQRNRSQHDDEYARCTGPRLLHDGMAYTFVWIAEALKD